ncbi:MAG: glycosyltransferase [Candidatus Yanofskybacteria bacterium]|nr:glycosyltransferase [Candidatus Yanofskybacteria bacterium]
MKIALVHDYLNQYGGAERVLEVLCEIFPDAPIYTLLYDERMTGGVFREREVHTSFLQKMPFARKHHRVFPLLMPLAVEQFDLSYFDVVLSVSASFAKGIITKTHTKHVNYCLTPTRFLWDDSHRYIDEFRYPWPIQKLVPFFVAYLRLWDKEASLRVDRYIAISDFVKNRIKKYYNADANIIYPPVDTKKFAVSQLLDDYFLMVGRLVPYKRFDLAVKTFAAMGKPLWIVGDGPERKRLEKIACSGGNGHKIKFLGLVSDYKMPEFYSHAQAVIFPQEEDFGIVPLEAMASGRPVIAYRGGGALETIVEGRTGVFFDDQTEIALAQAVGEYYQKRWESELIREHALKFDKEVFRQKIIDTINNI